MFLRILKKDLQRRKATNVILLVFIMLASIFFSSSVNNAVAVLGGIDSFWEKAYMPEVFAIQLTDTAAEEVLDAEPSVDSWDSIPLTVMNPDKITFRGEALDSMSAYLFPFAEQEFLYFDENNDPIREVEPGTVRISATSLKKTGLQVGDTVVLEIGAQKREVTVAGPLKDATCLGNRYMINGQDYENWTSGEENLMQGSIIYINSNDPQATAKALSELGNAGLVVYEREFLRIGFFPDMILAGVLLVVSLCLILIAFVVLRFTISFTLSEEFRQIGVMKAIGLSNPGIRGLYLAKYLLLAVVGAVLGFFGSIPFSKLLLDSVSQTMVLGSDSSTLINVLCCAGVVVITLAFCYGCTAKVNKLTPVDAIRSGTTGERFHKKGLLRVEATPGTPAFFLALNDVVSQPRRFAAVVLTLTLCLCLVQGMASTANTLKNDGLITAFGMIPFDLISTSGIDADIYVEGNKALREQLQQIGQQLSENGIEGRCCTEVSLALTASHGEDQCNTYVFQGIGTNTHQYDYFQGTAPSRPGEIAITQQISKMLNASIGDTVTLKIGQEEREFIVTALFQTMMNQGMCARIHQDEVISYEYLINFWGLMIAFDDDPDEKTIRERMNQIQELLDLNEMMTAGEFVEDATQMSGTINTVGRLILAISAVITVMLTSLMGHSFISKERCDIAILKAIGFRDSQVVAWQTLRFVIACALAVLLAIPLHLPLLKLAVDPIFSMMGANFGIRYEIRPLEIFLVYPAIFMAITCVSAFFTAQHTRTIKTNECSNIE